MKNISGNLYFQQSDGDRDGGQYTVTNPYTDQGTGISTLFLNPEDLRKMADHLEKTREKTTIKVGG